MTEPISIWRDGKMIGVTDTIADAKAWAKKQSPSFGTSRFEIRQGEKPVAVASLNGAERAKWTATAA